MPGEFGGGDITVKEVLTPKKVIGDRVPHDMGYNHDLAVQTEPTITPQVTPSDIRYGDRSSVIQAVVKDFDAGVKPTLEVTQALFARMLHDRIQFYIRNDGEDVLDQIPWPERTDPTKVALRDFRNREDQYGFDSRDKPVKEGESTTFPRGIYDFDDYDAILTVSMEGLARLDPTYHEEIGKMLLDSLPLLPEFDVDEVFTRYFRFFCESPKSKQLIAKLTDFVYLHRTEHQYSMYDDPINLESTVDTVLFNIKLSGGYGKIVDSIAEENDREKTKTILGMLVSNTSYPQILNLVRRKIKDADQDEEQVRKLTRLGKMLLGVEPDDNSTPFHTTLNSVYESLNFENYPPNEAVTEQELDLIEEVLSLLPGKEGNVVDLGTGFGRIANGLALRKNQGQLPQVYDIYGIDQSEKNIKGAIANDQTHLVKYRERDMKATQLGNNSAALTLSLGRNDHHLENPDEFIKAVKERMRITKMGGGILFDLANPNRGEYLNNRQRHIEILRSLHVPVDELGSEHELLRAVPYIVDGPKGEQTHIYNRYCPDPDWVIGIYKRLGCDVQIVKRVPIAGGEDDEDIYFLATKVREPEIPLIPNL